MTASAQPASEWDLFRRLLPPRLLDDLDPRAPQAAYTAWAVTWLLVYQRLHGNASLNDAVAEFALRFRGRASPGRDLSANTGAYSAARTGLDARVLHWAAESAYDTLVEAYPCSWRGRRAFFVDGSTVQLAPSFELRLAFPPASNQHGQSHWPILHLAVAHELESGLAASPEFGPMYGPEARSELSLAAGVLARLPAGSILLGDRNFGVFAFAWAAARSGHDVLLRLTEARFEALKKKAGEAGPGRWELTWRPSAYDRKAHPELPPDAEVTGWLHEVRVSEGLTLWLFETAQMTGQEAAGLYHKRQDVETDIRDLKQTLCLGEMTCKSAAMVEKELAAAVLAYNLANQVRRLAARRLEVEPRRLSFAGVWSLLKAFAQGLLEGTTAAEAEAEFGRLLRAAGQRRPCQKSCVRGRERL
jgi:hypothetical protein